MGLFGKSFEEKVNEALQQIGGMRIGVSGLRAEISGKVVTLHGTAESKEAKTKAMVTFNGLVETENTINLIRLTEAAAPQPAVEAQPVVEAPPEETERWYVVVSGDTLGGISKKFYGKAGLYMKIFEANRDILDDPNMIKVGQRLRIPE